MGIREALKAATVTLAQSSQTPWLDAELLMAHALGMSREALLLSALDRAVPPAFAALLARRAAHEPVAYITGTRDFWTISLLVSPAVLIPRPDSESLIEAAVAQCGRAGPRTILDLGTGSGALLLAALSEWPEAYGIGIDLSDAALGIARANALRLGLDRRADFVRGDWGQGVEQRFDLILCNPPYVERGAPLAPDVCAFEPAVALYGGADGLEAYRLLMPQFGALLAPGGIVALEIGLNQADAVGALATQAGLAVQRYKDLAGLDRCLVLTLFV